MAKEDLFEEGKQPAAEKPAVKRFAQQWTRSKKTTEKVRS